MITPVYTNGKFITIIVMCISVYINMLISLAHLYTFTFLDHSPDLLFRLPSTK